MRNKSKEALKHFRDTVNLVLEYTSETVFETPVEQQKRIKRLLNNYAEFAEFYFPHYAKSKCGAFHIKAANFIKKNKRARLNLEWARAHAKSTHADIIIPIWLKCQKELKVMVLVGKSEDAAQVLLSDLQAELMANQRIIRDFGEQLKFGSWEKGRFVTQDDCAFFALGRGQSPRGLRYRQFRPDYIVLDDVDDDEIVRNPKRVNQVYDWALKAVLGASDMGQCRYIIANNRIAKHSVLTCFIENNAFTTITVNALDKNGQPTWKEKYSIQDINSMIDDLGYAKAQSELFNNPIVEGAVFKSEWILYRNPLPLKNYDYIISYCDPSFKNTDHSDYKAIITLGKSESFVDILETFVKKCTIKEMVSYWYDMYESLPEKVLIDFFMEGGLLMDMLFDEFVNEGKKRGFQLPLRRDGRKKPDKHARIESMTPLFERGFIHISNEIKDMPDTKLLLDQLLSFEKGNRGHDDAPDALEGALFIANQRTKRNDGSTRSGQFLKNKKRGM